MGFLKKKKKKNKAESGKRRAEVFEEKQKQEKRGRRAIVLSLDAIVAFLVFSMMVGALYLFEQGFWAPQVVHETLHETAQKAVNVLSRTRVVDVRREPYVVLLFANGTLSDEDLNKTLLEVIGAFWATNDSANLSIAANLSRELLSPIMPGGAQWALLAGDDVLYNSSDYALASGKQMGSSKKLVSGIAKTLPLTGCVARAYIQKIKGKNDVAYYFFGGFVGEGELTAVMRDVPVNSTAKSIFLELSVGDNFSLYLNGFNCSFFTRSQANYSIDSWTITNQSCLNQVIPGAENDFVIQFNGTDLTKQFIGGGYIAVTYNTTEMSAAPANSTRVYLPGIDGVVNYYASFFVPGLLTNASARLHFYNNYTTIFAVGNKTLMNTSGSDEDQTVFVSNASFANAFPDYNEISSKTIPLRFYTYANVTGGGGYADVVLITDVSGSMDWRMNNNNPGFERDCNDSHIYDNDSKRISVARCVDENFVDSILQGVGNRVALVSFNDNMDSYENLSANGTYLKQKIGEYQANGGTCICCAINQAYNLLNFTGLNQSLVPSKSTWSYNASFPTSTPPSDANGSNWTALNYNVSWNSASAVLGFGGVDSDIGNNLVVLAVNSYNAWAYSIKSGVLSAGALGATNVSDGNSMDFNDSVVQGSASVWIGKSDVTGSSNSGTGITKFMSASATSGDDYAVPTGYSQITRFRYNLGKSGDANSIKFKVFRHDGANYDVVYSSAASPIVEGSQQEVVLATPASVQQGDHIGFYASGGSSCYDYVKSNDNGDVRQYKNGDVIGNNVGFSSSTRYYHTVSALAFRPATYRTEVWFNSTPINASNLGALNASITFSSDVGAEYQALLYNFNSSAWETAGCTPKQAVVAGVWNTFVCNSTDSAWKYLSTANTSMIALNKTTNSTYGLTKIDLIRFQTVQETGNYFFRKKFYIANKSLVMDARLSVYSDDRAQVYVNGNLVDSDPTPHSASYWNRNASVPVAFLNQGWNVIAVKLFNNDATAAKFDLELNATMFRTKYVIVMTDGIAAYRCTSTSTCGTLNSNCGGSTRCYAGNDTVGSTPACCNGQSSDCNNAGCNAASNNSNYSSCRIHRELNATVHSVGFGPVASCSLANATLNAIAQCGNGSYFTSTNASQLADFYKNLASAIVQQTTTQVVFLAGEMATILYPDSYIDFAFTPSTPPYGYQEISVSLETPAFPSCEGSFAIPPQLTVDEFKTSSYSSDYWTSNVSVKNSGTGGAWLNVFNLSAYGSDYRLLGDPFFVQFNASLLKSGETNYLSVRTASSPTNASAQCSTRNKGFYKARVQAAVNYSMLFQYCKARNVTVYYDSNFDGVADGSVNISVGGPTLPSAGAAFVPVEQLDLEKNAVDDAFQRLLNQLDFIPGGVGPSGSASNPIGIELSDEVDSSALTGQGIPFAWGPTEVTVVTWS